MSDVDSERLNSQMVGASPSPRATSSGLKRLFWMNRRIADAKQRTFDASKPGFAWYQVARQLCNDVVTIEETKPGSPSALLLDCTAAGLLVRAHLAREGWQTGSGPLSEADWEKAHSIPIVAEAWSLLTPTQASTLFAWLGTDRDASMTAIAGKQSTGRWPPTCTVWSSGWPIPWTWRRIASSTPCWCAG